VFVKDRRRQVRILSNNHVLANSNDALIGDPILQPGQADGGLDPDNVIGQLVNFVPLQNRGNRVDAAVASIGTQDAFPDDLSIPGVGLVQGFWKTVPPRAHVVRKYGRTTKLTTGRVTALGLRGLPVSYGSFTARFDGVIEVHGSANTPKFSAGGDSGSLVVDSDRNAVGLLFAGNEQATYLNPIGEVMSSLGLFLVR